MNYRHAFHAGNFADLLKHASLIAVLSRLLAEPGPITTVDTHAGAGLYDLAGPEAERSREARSGAARLMGGDLPPVMAELRRAVQARNPSGALRVYPGSPVLIAERLRPEDRLVACELRPDDHARLQAALAPAGPRARALQTNGYEELTAIAGRRPGRLFALIDPPFERADDYVRLAQAAQETLDAVPQACLLIWTPLKDLETFDACVRRLEPIAPERTLIAEARLRRLTDPMRLNGCALIAVNAPAAAEADLEAACAFVVEALGEPGGRANLWRP
jgi:23S rRNA (adenine2030-N6)-methyltransferase